MSQTTEELFRRASELLGDEAGIESNPYGLPSHQGTEPPEEKALHLDWARDVRRWYRFRAGTGDATVWRLYAEGRSVREIGAELGRDWSWIAARIRRLTAEVKAAEERRANRPRTIAGLVEETDPLFLIHLLAALG